MVKRRIILALGCTIFITISLCAQINRRINKYAVGIEVALGHSFPAFSEEQNRWRATFYPAGSFSVTVANRIHRNWILDAGLGLTAYFLTNRGSVDSYVLDFASPHFSTGVSYNFQKMRGQEYFLKLSAGGQVGYQGTFVDELETYRVTVHGSHAWYPFVRPEIGFRSYAKKRMKGSRYRTAFEFGAYFRYNLNTLGQVMIEEADFTVMMEPRGSIIGAYFRVLFPMGRKSTRLKPEAKPILPPIIYHPRSKQ